MNLIAIVLRVILIKREANLKWRSNCAVLGHKPASSLNTKTPIDPIIAAEIFISQTNHNHTQYINLLLFAVFMRNPIGVERVQIFSVALNVYFCKVDLNIFVARLTRVSGL